MFCGKCGAKISPENSRCESCGAPAEYAEYCGGFWGLVGQTPPTKTTASVPDEAASKKPSRFNRFKTAVPIVLCLIFVILFALQSIKTAGLLRELDRQRTISESLTRSSGTGKTDLQGQIDQLNDDVIQANSENADLQSQITKLISDLNTANSRNTELQTQLDEAKATIDDYESQEDQAVMDSEEDYEEYNDQLYDGIDSGSNESLEDQAVTDSEEDYEEYDDQLYD